MIFKYVSVEGGEQALIEIGTTTYKIGCFHIATLEAIENLVILTTISKYRVVAVPPL